MGRVRLAAVAAVVALAAGASILAQQQRQPPRDPGSGSGGGRIAGVVSSREGPVEGATVKLTSSTWRQSTTVTDAEGRFRFSGLAEGLYTLSAEKDAYIDSTFGASQSPRLGGVGTQIALASNQQLLDVAMPLPRGGIIAGTITGADGLPAAETNVTLVVPERSGMAGHARTDAKGEYRFAGLFPGEYRVVAAAPAGYAPVYHPGVVDPRQATTVRVKEEERKDGVDFAFVLVRPVRVTGTIVDAAGQPAPGVQVAAMPSDASMWLRVKSDADGRFVFDGITPGTYRVTAAFTPPAETAPGGVARDMWAEATLDVSADRVPDLVLKALPRTVFSGRIQLDIPPSGRPLDLSVFRVFLTKPGFHPGEAKVEADGTFRITMIPGMHEVSATAPDASTGLRLRSAMWRSRDLLDDPPEFDPGADDFSDVVLTFTNRHTELSGMVRNADDAPVHEAWVVIFPTDRGLWNDYSPRLSWVRPATDGRFMLRDVPAGAYHIAAVRDLDWRRWKSAEFLTALAAVSSRVRLEEGKPATQDLRLAR